MINNSDSDQDQKKTDIFEERRKFLRLNINVEINYSVIPDEGQQSTTSKNISVGGICILAHEELSAGSKLKLDISLPDDPPTIQAIGRVVWVKPFSISGEETSRYYVGVEFIEISDEEREKIKKYVFSVR